MIKTLNIFQRGIILFWALWFTLVSFSDIGNFLQVIHLLPAGFAFSSQNYPLVMQDFLVYHISSPSLVLLAFGFLIVCAILIAVAFWVALYSANSAWIKAAFFLSSTLTGFFILSDEFFIQYSLEHGHTLRLMLQLITFLYFYER